MSKGRRAVQNWSTGISRLPRRPRRIRLEELRRCAQTRWSTEAKVLICASGVGLRLHRAFVLLEEHRELRLETGGIRIHLSASREPGEDVEKRSKGCGQEVGCVRNRKHFVLRSAIDSQFTTLH